MQFLATHPNDSPSPPSRLPPAPFQYPAQLLSAHTYEKVFFRYIEPNTQVCHVIATMWSDSPEGIPIAQTLT